MNISDSFGISSSALTAQRLRMDVISSNIANAETTRAKIVDGKAVPYRRKTVVMAPKEMDFDSALNSVMGKEVSSQGVKITKIQEDPSPLKPVYNPTHPDADSEGYVYMPNVDILKEMVDMISATRSYEANVTALNASKAMFTKALQIGK
ncbi:flagellar basal body rod protein FlgC [Paenibacillus phoenicis]|uniref:Flagellar basal-body rod protein FlgC n=2 Tax=Paenibacillus TaxID=44249 RepID=A0ABY1LWY9_9BACL|nr:MULTISPECIES: flagellar basal body rod protein FlgC [Paenibacillus]EES75049.1 flagellar basal-body rod protein FlgC [Paenibacillus sp. oral taxon 786 str. D14]MCT2196727.1 flagellar basal body rod protein FlgC [Paenibacillus sp. p3-SID1389]MDU0331386.1 flagellar basal body rod protein FlgC [Paenibacillus sp. 3LSP]MEA3569265.1 flagellar basal body rod protein FlgC [Paenibacillus phoenicis]MEC2346055.1 flagellar basal body rod protein FlgC [Paenibacillus barengoltzii]